VIEILDAEGLAEASCDCYAIVAADFEQVMGCRCAGRGEQIATP
jgi:hypothetical protein